MYQMAKTAREKMKAKARSLAGAKEQKVDSSDWTPAPLLKAEVKTGARPIMKPSSKGVGESNAARDTKAAIGKDLKRGGFKTGGAVKDAGVKDKKALGAIDPSPKRGPAGHYKKGGKIKKADGGILSDIANALAGRGYIDGSTWIPQEAPMTASDAGAPMPPRRPSGVRARPMSRSKPRIERENPQLTKEYALQERYPYIDETISNAEVPMQSGRFMKKGGKVKRSGRAMGGKDPSYVGSESVTKDNKPVMRPKDIQDTRQREPQPSDLYSSDQMKRLERGYKKGGEASKRKGRATGGGLLSTLMGGKKKMSKKGGKTDINIVINAGQKAPMRRPAEPMAPPPGADMGMPPMPPSVGAAPPAGPMPAGLGAGPGGMPEMPIGRKAGGRITKVASSYKDMQAGAASGEGRLQKTDIAKKYKDAPARKAGGRISKVAKSYKDMTAGAASGEGRLQKEDIAKAKKVRAK